MLASFTVHARGVVASAALAVVSLLGPPSVHITAVTAATKGAPAGAVLLMEGKHHDEFGKVRMSGRAEAMQNGKRFSKPLVLTKLSEGHFAISKQWTDGSPWVLVFSVEQGDEGHNGVAEALVKVDARGTIVDISHRKPDVVSGTKTPLRVTEKDIMAALSSIPK